MNPFKLPATPEAILPDLDVGSSTVNFRKSFVTYAATSCGPSIKDGAAIKAFVDEATARIGFKIVALGKSDALRACVPAGCASPKLNNVKLVRFIERKFGKDYSRWSLCPASGEVDVDYAFEPTTAAIKRVRHLLARLPEILGPCGFRTSRAKGDPMYFGENINLTLSNGALYAFSRGRDVGTLHVCAPVVSEADIVRWAKNIGDLPGAASLESSRSSLGLSHS